MVFYHGLKGDRYSLEGSNFAGGGEALVYHIKNKSALVAKIYKDGKCPPDHEQKIRIMVENPPSNKSGEIAWPVDALYDSNNKFSGFVMPIVKNTRSLEETYVYDKRTDPWSNYLRIAQNLAVAVNNVHEAGHVIGDLNPKNVLVDVTKGKVTLVDTDSFHIIDNNTKKIYPCIVGTPEHLPHELQGKKLSSLSPNDSYNRYTDNFALAVMIFRLLMNGVHPFVCKVKKGANVSGSQFENVTNIKNGFCPYFPKNGDARYSQIEITPASPDLSYFPSYIRDLFKKAFDDGYTDPTLRPEADTWYTALIRLENELTTCPNNPNHQYYKHAHSCPWCLSEERLRNILKNRKSNNQKAVNSHQNSTTVSNTQVNTATATSAAAAVNIPAYQSQQYQQAYSQYQTNIATPTGVSNKKPVKGKVIALIVALVVIAACVVTGVIVFNNFSSSTNTIIQPTIDPIIGNWSSTDSTYDYERYKYANVDYIFNQDGTGYEIWRYSVMGEKTYKVTPITWYKNSRNDGVYTVMFKNNNADQIRELKLKNGVLTVDGLGIDFLQTSETPSSPPSID